MLEFVSLKIMRINYRVEFIYRQEMRNYVQKNYELLKNKVYKRLLHYMEFEPTLRISSFM